MGALGQANPNIMAGFKKMHDPAGSDGALVARTNDLHKFL